MSAVDMGQAPAIDAVGLPLAIITGGAGGIGLELGRRLLRRGHRLLIVERELDVALRACHELGEQAFPYACYLSDAEQVRQLGKDISERWSHTLAVLACNAGVIIPGDVSTTSEQAVDVQIEVMLKSALQLIRAASPDLLERDGGHILATVSNGGIYPMPGSATYSAAKAGLRAFLAATATELWDTNVHVGGIYPSAVDTPMLLKRRLATAEGRSPAIRASLPRSRRSRLPTRSPTSRGQSSPSVSVWSRRISRRNWCRP